MFKGFLLGSMVYRRIDAGITIQGFDIKSLPERPSVVGQPSANNIVPEKAAETRL